MSMVGFPLLLIPLAIFNIIVFLMPGVSFSDPVLRLPLTSGAEWPVTLSDMLLALAILMLLFEVIKGARPGAKYLTDHLLSLVVFGGAVAEFLLWPRFASSTFFLLTLLAMVDFLSGVALRTRRAKVATPVPAAVPVRSDPEPPVAAAPEPRPAPTPELRVPAAAAVAESVLLDHPAPKTAQAEATPRVPAPEYAPVPENVTPPEPVSAPKDIAAPEHPGDVAAPDHAPAPETVAAPAPVSSPEPVTSPEVPSPELPPGVSKPPHEPTR
jgi:hypothetical protein